MEETDQEDVYQTRGPGEQSCSHQNHNEDDEGEEEEPEYYVEWEDEEVEEEEEDVETVVHVQDDDGEEGDGEEVLGLDSAADSHGSGHDGMEEEEDSIIEEDNSSSCSLTPPAKSATIHHLTKAAEIKQASAAAVHSPVVSCSRGSNSTDLRKEAILNVMAKYAKSSCKMAADAAVVVAEGGTCERASGICGGEAVKAELEGVTEGRHTLKIDGAAARESWPASIDGAVSRESRRSLKADGASCVDKQKEDAACDSPVVSRDSSCAKEESQSVIVDGSVGEERKPVSNSAASSVTPAVSIKVGPKRTCKVRASFIYWYLRFEKLTKYLLSNGTNTGI
jgi:hypothetical protein